MSMDPGKELALPITASELVAAYEKFSATIKRCFAEVDQAQKEISIAYGNAGISISNHSVVFHDPDRALQCVSEQCWYQLLVRLNVRGLVSLKQWKEITYAVEKHNFPRLSAQSVMELYQSMTTQHEELHQQAIREVFETLRPWRRKYKSNDKYIIGRKVILEGWVRQHPCIPDRIELIYHYQSEAAAVERVIQGLQGKGTMHKDGHDSELEHAIKANPIGETSLFKYKAFKKGSLHLEFKDLEALAKLNAICGGKNFKGHDSQTTAAPQS